MQIFYEQKDVSDTWRRLHGIQSEDQSTLAQGGGSAEHGLESQGQTVEKQASQVNKIVTVTEEGFEYEADQMHAEFIVNELKV
jgi:hypothetical protein